MAGIGFELKKLFSGKGAIATIRAYSYATAVCAGPMLLGFILLFLSMIMVEHTDASEHTRKLAASILSHTLLSSITVNSLFSMLTTRFCADMIYEKNYERIMPSFYGSIAVMMVSGAVLYGVFLHFSGIRLLYRVLAMIFFLVLIVVWTEINYLTMLKDFKSIMVAFAVSVASALLLAAACIWILKIEAVAAILLSVTAGYMMMMVWYFAILYKTFPEGFGTSLRFLEWIDRIPQLVFTGFFTTLGLFGHLVIMWWCSSLSVRVQGLFYGAPSYDVPAVFAFFSILITTVNFIISVETRFYPEYKEYFSLFNDGGSIENIDEQEKKMIRVLSEEIGYLALKQIFSTLIFIIAGTILLPILPLGFDDKMLRIYRTLCVGYAFYAIGNSLMLISQYFSDMRGALVSTGVFAAATNLLTLLFTFAFDSFYGMPFVLGSMCFCIIAFLILCNYLKKLKYNVLSKQSLFAGDHGGFFTGMANHFELRAARVQRRRRTDVEKKEDLENEK